MVCNKAAINRLSRFITAREIRVSGNSTSVRLEELSPHTWYTISVAALNRVGRSDFTAPLRHATLQEKPQGQPKNVQVSNYEK